MGTANNHTLDYGTGGVSATLNHLDDAGIVGRERASTCKRPSAPRFRRDAGGGRVALIGCASTVAPHAPCGVWPAVTTQESPALNAIPRLVCMSTAEAAAATRCEERQRCPVCPSSSPARTFLRRRVLSFLGTSFVEATTPDLPECAAPGSTMKRIVDVVDGAAYLRALWAVSIHAHEIYKDLQGAGSFSSWILAHAAIEAGADALLYHGSHYMAGMETSTRASRFSTGSAISSLIPHVRSARRRLLRGLQSGAALDPAE